MRACERAANQRSLEAEMAVNVVELEGASGVKRSGTASAVVWNNDVRYGVDVDESGARNWNQEQIIT